jgi:hypothetical protein
VIGSVAVSALLLFNLKFDFVDFLVALVVDLVSVSHAALARRDRHDTY